MKFKRIIALFLCAFMSLALFSSCGGGNAGIDFGDAFSGTEAENPYPLDTKVAFIYSGHAGSDPLIDIFEKGREQVEKTLGAETAYMEGVILLQFEEAAEKCIDEGYNIIVAASNRFNSAVVLVARKYPEILFISFGGSDQAPNLASVQPLLYQAANVCGFIAAYNTSTNKIGMVMDTNMYNAYGMANAFALGARELQPSQIDVSLAWALSTHFEDTRAAILDLIAQGCDIIFVYQFENFGLRFCEEMGVKAIGFAYDVPDIAPENYLTGMYLNLNTFLIDKVRNYMYGNISSFGDITRRGLLHGMVGMIGINDNIAVTGTRDISDALIEHINNERSMVFGGEIRDRDDIIRVERGTALQIPQAFTIRWLANNITSVEDFSVPLTELVYSDLVLKS